MMEWTEFTEGIKLPQPALSALRNHIQNEEIDEAEYARLKELYYRDRNRFYEQICAECQFRLRFLYLFIRFAVDLYEEYQNRKIDSEIFFDTFFDLSLWTDNCFRDFGEYGIAEYDWFFRHLECKLFRLGRLQYEIMESPWSISAGNHVVHPGETVINVHIPQGEKLLQEAVRESIGRAKRFWKKEYVYVCHSWLLYPGLRDVLPATSNILQFQSFFDIVAIDFDTREAESRIYGLLRDNIAEYPELSSLQKRAKKYLLAGNRLGSGLGILNSE